MRRALPFAESTIQLKVFFLSMPSVDSDIRHFVFLDSCSYLTGKHPHFLAFFFLFSVSYFIFLLSSLPSPSPFLSSLLPFPLTPPYFCLSFPLFLSTFHSLALPLYLPSSSIGLMSSPVRSQTLSSLANDYQSHFLFTLEHNSRLVHLSAYNPLWNI